GLVAPPGVPLGTPNATVVTIENDDISTHPPERPVVLVRGMWNHSNFEELMIPALKAAGYDVRGPFDLADGGKAHIADSAAKLKAFIEAEFPGTAPVDIDIIAHSAGG